MTDNPQDDKPKPPDAARQQAGNPAPDADLQANGAADAPQEENNAPAAEELPPAAAKPQEQPEPPTPLEELKFTPQKNLEQVFVLAGQKEKLRSDCLQCLNQWGLNPVILNAPQKESRTAEQILDAHPGVAFAVILLSGDYFFYSKDSTPTEARLFAGQDFVFDLGYLMGRLGKANIFVLYHEQKSFLLPLRHLAAMGIPYNTTRDWRDILKKRLTTAGYPVDGASGGES